MNSEHPDRLSPDELERIDEVCREFEAKLRSGAPVAIETLLPSSGSTIRSRLLSELLAIEIEYRRHRGEDVGVDEYVKRFSDDEATVRDRFAAAERGEQSSVGSTVAFDAGSQAGQLAELLAEYRTKVESGKTPNKDEWLARYPHLAAELATGVAGIEFVRQSTFASMPTLGDFRLLREIGRGGMGAVYEAEQLSLGRRVAVKILWFGGLGDPEAITRFQREAETVARLHHTNIVPIFSVGCERHVYYYAMQLINGRSLDNVARSATNSLDVSKVAEWGLQAAEALTHAHQRGIVHRDIKPSNLLLDEEGQIWLSDFGLAKRQDDVKLSLTGTLLGTPRYMSPEQASAAKLPVDHRTDVYSLGATLYELVTGKPVFDADTPHAVISQIIANEPIAPRIHRPQLPRDFNTILMKCLAKNPSQRYQSAKDLSDDLRAFLDGRPIRARQPSLVEQFSMWFRRQRRNVSLSLTVVGITIAILLFGITGWYAYSRGQISNVTLRTKSPPMLAEILTATGEPLTRPEIVPTRTPIEIPGGEYRLRCTSHGLLSQTYQAELQSGEFHDYEISAQSDMFGSPIEYEYGFNTVHGTNQCALITTEGGSLVAIRSNGERISANFSDLLGTDRAALWPPSRCRVPGNNFDESNLHPFIVREAKDLDGDGIGDVIIAAKHQAWILAVSGANLSRLWLIRRGEDPTVLSKQYQSYDGTIGVRNAVVGEPSWITDINGDGVGDIVATFVDIGDAAPNGNIDSAKVVRWVEAISGKDGASLWKRDLPAEWFSMANRREAPYRFRWFTSPGVTSMSTGGFSFSGRILSRYVDRRFENTGPHAYVPDTLRPIAQSDVAVLAGGNHLAVVSLKNGEIIAEIENNFRFGQPIGLADVNGDGKVDVIGVSEAMDGPVVRWTGRPIPQLKMVAWSIDGRVKLWERTLETLPPSHPEWWVSIPHWPQFADVDGDGASEVLVPNGSSAFSGTSEDPWGGVELIDGKTGETRWMREVAATDQVVQRMICGPDIDGDGQLDVFVSSLWGMPSRLYVDCISGKTGDTIWSRHVDVNEWGQSEPNLGPLSFWYASRPSGVQIVVPVLAPTPSPLNSRLITFDAITGDPAHFATDVHDYRVDDLNDDGVDDLLLVRFRNMEQGGKGTVAVVEGSTPEQWRRLGAFSEIVCDVDADNVRDVVEIANGTIVMRTGVSGAVLWRTNWPSRSFTYRIHHSDQDDGRYVAKAPALWDIDRDSVPDLIIEPVDGGDRPLIGMVSGKTGRILWNTQRTTRSSEGVPFIRCLDLDGDERAEVVYYGFNDSDMGRRFSYSTNDGAFMVVVLDSLNGVERFRASLSEPFGGGGTRNPYTVSDHRFDLTVVDLNHDGVRDLIAYTGSRNANGGIDLVALNGRNGETMWRHAGKVKQNSYDSLRFAPIVVPLPDKNGGNSVVALEFSDPMADREYLRVASIQWLSPSTGEIQREKRYDIARDFSNLDMSPQIMVPVSRGSDRPWFAANLKLPGGKKVIVFDADGNEVQQYALTDRYANTSRCFVIPVDADRDGNEELLVHDGVMVLVSPADGKVIRRFGNTSLPNSPQLDLTNENRGQRELVISARDGSRVQTIAYELMTGERQWHCMGPRRGDYVAPATYLGRSDNLPLVVYAVHPAWYCRTGVPFASRSPSPIAGRAQPRATLLNLAILNNAREKWARQDERLIRSVHWAPAWPTDYRSVVRYYLWSFWFAITLIILPGSVVVVAMNRRWSLQAMLVLPVVVGIALVASTMRVSQSELQDVKSRFIVGLLGVPMLYGCYATINWFRGGSWKTLLAVLGYVVLGAVLIGGLLAFANRQSSGPVNPKFVYTWNGAQFNVLVGIYGACCGCLVEKVGRWFAERLRSAFRKKS